jgi:hypothetical protein
MKIGTITLVSMVLVCSCPTGFSCAHCPGLVPAFSWSSDNTALRFTDRTDDPFGYIDSVKWTLGDGSPEQTGSPIWHTYSAAGADTVHMTVWAQGCELGISAPVPHGDANDDCGIVIDPSFTTAQPGNNVVDFVNTSYTGGLPFTQAWSFGDDDLSLAPAPSHTYLFPGAYTVALILAGTDTATLDGCVGGMAQLIYVDGNASTCDTSLFADVSYLFDGVAAYLHADVVVMDPDLEVMGFVWSFGDGAPGVSDFADPQHTYAYPGTYQVCLTVSAAHLPDTLDTCSAEVCRTLVPALVGIEEPAPPSGLVLRPNPASDVVILEHPMIAPGAEAQLFDGMGRIQRVQQNAAQGQARVAIQDLAPGTYSVRLISDQEVKWGRLVKR